MEKETKKSYNPFKMWGSWVGLIMFFISALFFLRQLVIAVFFCDDLIDEFCSYYNFGPYLVVFLIPITTGFLIGWGIHSIFRKFRS